MDGHLDSPSPLEQPLQPCAEPPRRKCAGLVRKTAAWCLAGLVVAFLVFLNIYYRNLYMQLYEITKSVISARSWGTYANVFLINVLLQMCFVPGISFFVMFIGFVCGDFLYAASLVIPSTTLICALTFLLTKYTIRDFLKERLSNKWYFQMFYLESARKPWATSFLLRFILIPVTYKNYLIALMNINFVQFIVPCALFYTPYFSCYICIGMTVSTAQDIINGRISEAERKVFLMYLAIYLVFIAFSVVFCVYLVRMTCRLRERYLRAAGQDGSTSPHSALFAPDS